MTVVLGDPSATAQTDDQIAEQKAGHVAGPLRAENLPVPGVMAQEADLGEHHGQERGHPQLPPRVTHQDQGPRPGGQQHRGGRDLPELVTRAALQQPGLHDLTGQLRVCAVALTRQRRGSRPQTLPGPESLCFRRSHPGTPSRHKREAAPGSGARRPGSSRVTNRANSPDQCRLQRLTPGAADGTLARQSGAGSGQAPQSLQQNSPASPG